MTATMDGLVLHVEHGTTSAAQQRDADPGPGPDVRHLPVADIRPNPRQPRAVFTESDLASLADSIKQVGVLQPVVVRPGSPGAGWELVAGERRLRASIIAGLNSIPAVVADVPDDELLRQALIENVQRADLNLIETAVAYRQLMQDRGWRQEDLAAMLGKSRQHVGHVLGLLRLPTDVQLTVASGVLTFGHAKVIIGAAHDESVARRLAERAVREGLSVQALKEIVILGNLAGWEQDVLDKRPPQRKKKVPKRDPGELAKVSAALDDWLNTRVTVAAPRGKAMGRIVIEFADPRDLERVLAQMRVPGLPVDQ